MNLVGVDSLLSRVLEPEAMDTADDARDYDSMDHGEVNRLFVADLLAALRATAPMFNPDAVSGLGPLLTLETVLDLGTGTARIPIELCRQDPRAQVLAIDLAESMLQLARGNIERAGLAARIAVQRVDAKRLPFADHAFAAVISNSIVHHIPEPRIALAEAVRVLQPHGLIFVRDLARPRDDHQVRQLVGRYAADCNDHQRALFDASLRAALSVAEIRVLVETLGFSASSVQPTSDRHWTWSAVMPR